MSSETLHDNVQEARGEQGHFRLLFCCCEPYHFYVAALAQLFHNLHHPFEGVLVVAVHRPAVPELDTFSTGPG